MAMFVRYYIRKMTNERGILDMLPTTAKHQLKSVWCVVRISRD